MSEYMGSRKTIQIVIQPGSVQSIQNRKYSLGIIDVLVMPKT